MRAVDLVGILARAWLAFMLAAPVAAQEAGISVSISGDRLALMRLATGASVDLDPQMIAAPGSGGEAIYLQSGDATLDELVAAVSDSTRPDALVRTGDRVVAKLPIIVLQGSSLTLGAGDRLELDRIAGSYVVSLGQLVLNGARVESGDGRHPRIEGFRPFLAGLGQDSIVLNDSTLDGLGYNDTPYSAGLFVSGRGLLSVGSARPMNGNSFTDLRGVSLSRLDGIELRDNDFEASRGSSLSLHEIGGGIVEDLGISGNRGRHALHISGAKGLDLRRVRIEDSQGKGLRIDDDSRGVSFADMAVTGSDGSGVTIGQGASCVLFERTEIAQNDGAGLVLRGAGSMILSQAYIARNDGPGLLINSQLDGSRVLVADSTFAGNRIGLRGAGVTALRLHGNDLSGQRPRLLSGDLDPMTPDYLRAIKGNGHGDLAIRNVRVVAPEPLGANAARAAFGECSDPGTES